MVGRLSRSKAYLRIFGDAVDPDEITKLLGAAPTHAERTGEIVRSPNGRERVVRRGNWRLEATDRQPEDLDAQIAEILRQLTNDLNCWRDLAERFDVDLFCGLFMSSTNEGIVLSPAALEALGVRHIKIGFDVYGSEKPV